ncbi:MAG: S-methyl-5'-thioadenosine phosphorylase [Thermodesulfovibrionales bacterium]|nr:S-methyl-5'-thioadenosine phosphorylase [Thermodesulfovibrionales bacterium]
MPTGIIAGSGLYEISGFETIEIKKINTPFGDPSDSYRIGRLNGHEVIFLPRHGSPHRIPPHRVNYRANIWGFRELGVERIISVSAVGGISNRLKPGDLVILDQIIDMTFGARQSTFYDNEVVHVDFTEPYCPELRRYLIDAAEVSDLDVHPSGTYVAVNGPRLETRAEIAYFKLIGADVVGMTAMPETVLARELEICFGGIAVVTNYAAGISKKKLTTTEVIENMRDANRKIIEIIRHSLSGIERERNCPCKESLKEARL